MTAGRPRAFNSTLPARTRYMNPGKGLSRSSLAASGAPLGSSTLVRGPWLRPVPAATGSGGVLPLRTLQPARPARSTIPPDVLALVDARDGHYCTRCGRWREVIEHHHRRIKGMGGSISPHTECACCILSLCAWWDEPACHAWTHRNRLKAEAEGLIIPRSAPSPWLHPVLVHEKDGAGGQARWPLCDGTWSTDEPDGAAA